jgi:hypothetical protein
MSNRNLNGLSSSVRSLNGLSTKLKDGKAIKIADENEIDVNFLTNTTEQTTLGDTDLFLLSDNLGSNIQYINGLRIKQQINNSLVAGNNINFTTSGNHRQINVNTALTGMVSIDGAGDLTLKRAGTTRNTIGSSSTRFHAFNTTLGGILLIDKGTGGQSNSEDYEILHDYLSGGFITGKADVGLRIRRKGTDNYDQLFCGHLQDDGNCVMLKPNNDLNYIFKSGELKINKADLSSHDFIINLVNSASTFSVNNIATATLDCNTFKTCNSRLVAIRDSNDLYLFNNATLPAEVGNNNEFLKQSGDGSNLIIRADNIKFFNGTTEGFRIASHPTTANDNRIEVFKNIDMNDNRILFHTDNITDYICYTGITGEDGLLYCGRGSNDKVAHRFITSEVSPDTDLMKLYTDKIEMFKPLYMNSAGASGSSTDRPIYLHTNTAFFIKYKFDSTSGSKINGVEIGGFGGSNGFDTACLRISATDATYAGRIAEFMPSKINMYKPIDMNNQILNFKQNTDNPPNYSNYIKYTSDLMDGLELKGDGSTTNPFFKVKTSNNNVDLMNVYTNRVDVFKKLSVIKDSSSLQNDPNDIFTVRNNGFCKAIIHSQINDCELALKCGSDNSNQAVIKRFTSNDLFLINNIGEIRTEGTNHNFYNSTTLRLAFQSDTNLVVYDGSTVKFASNDSKNAHSSIQYKKNINDLVESESINIIKNINPVSFEYLEKYWDKHDQCNACNCNVRKGFIWEDTKPILPQACRTINMDNPDEETTYTLDVREVIPDLVKVNQYLLNEISTLKEQLLTQSNLISNLQSQINI